MKLKTSPREDRFHKATLAWLEADKECSRTFAIWNDACERRLRLAAEKNEAWREVDRERAAVITQVGSTK